jgi:hypothetical protein
MQLNHNSAEFIKSQILVSTCGLQQRLHSEDVCGHLELSSDRDEAFNEAIEFISERLQGWDIEVTENGDTMTATWTKQ